MAAKAKQINHDSYHDLGPWAGPHIEVRNIAGEYVGFIRNYRPKGASEWHRDEWAFSIDNCHWATRFLAKKLRDKKKAIAALLYYDWEGRQ